MSVTFIDCHTHLYSNEFDEDRAEVIKAAKEGGVAGALLCAEKVVNFPSILQLAEQHGNFCWPCLGVHPVQGDSETNQARSVNLQDFEPVIEWVEKHHTKLVAIGEVDLAKKFDLPLNVHSRSAGRPTIALLKEAGAEKVLLHAFDGKASVALQGVQAGYYFSIPPSIVRSTQKSKLVEQVPLENLLLETDSPALGPVKDERNVPANVKISCEYIAKVKGVDIETVAKITWENSLKLFPKIRNYMPK